MPKESFSVSFHGSRTLNDERVRIIILEEIEKHKPSTVITHGEPEGVCGMTRKICREKAIPLKLFYLNFKYLRGAFEHRSKDILADSDHAILIHDGESKGTTNELKLAIKMNVPHTFHKIERTKHATSVGFDIDVNWDKLNLDIDL